VIVVARTEIDVVQSTSKQIRACCPKNVDREVDFFFIGCVDGLPISISISVVWGEAAVSGVISVPVLVVVEAALQTNRYQYGR
jgi:hypothetical protein